MTTIYKKLDKLKAFAERDCGHESTNAINLIKKLCEKHNITDFNYTPWQEKKEESKSELVLRKFSYSRKMKSILETYLDSRIQDGWVLSYMYSGTILHIQSSFETYNYLVSQWEKIKKEYKREQKNLKSYMESYARTF